jgi:putative copper export protein
VIEPVLAALQQWILFVGISLVVGCAAWRLVVARQAAGVVPETVTSQLVAIERRVTSVGVATALALVVGWALKMVVQVLGFHFPGDPLWPDVSFLLFDTFWGTVWMAQGALIFLTAIAFWLARPPGRDAAADPTGPTRTDPRAVSSVWWVVAVLALGLVASLALAGHAMGVERWRALLVAADGVHTLAAGTWIGSLALVLWVGRPEGRSRAGLELYAEQIRNFSPMAIVSVATLLSMGVVLAWTHLTAVSDLWTETYGRILSAKIVVAGIVFGAGFVNWRRGIPALGTEAGAHAVQRRAVWEVSMAVGVLLLTAVLVHAPKP